MRRLQTWLAMASAWTALALLVPGPAQAQDESVVDQADLDRAIAERFDDQASERQAILRLLEREEVQALAEDAGLDLRRAEGAISTLEGEELSRMAALATSVDQELAGGQGGPAPRPGVGRYFPVLYGVALLVLVLLLVLT